MSELLTPFLFSISACVAILYALRPHAAGLGLLDQPDRRKQHGEPVPMIGGVAAFFALMLTCLLFDPERSAFAVLVFAAVSLLMVGLVDDIHGMSAREKLVAQFGVAAIAVFVGGARVDDLGDLFGFGSADLGYWAYPFSIVCVVGTINAFNMTDGVDGLAGGLGLVAALSFAYVAALSNAVSELVLALAIAGALLGFLWFNLPHRQRPFRVFLGDSGSTMLGLVLAWLAISITQRGERPTLTPIAAVWILGVPLLDMGGTLALRIARGRNPLKPDRSHLHHLLQRLGYTMRQVVVVEVLAAVGCAGIGIGACRAGVPEAVMAWSFLAVAVAFLASSALGWLRVADQMLQEEEASVTTGPRPQLRVVVRADERRNDSSDRGVA